MPDPRYCSLRAAVAGDLRRAFTMAGCGALAFAPIEYALTLWAYAGPIEFLAKARLVALVATLALWLFLVLLVATFGVMTIARLWRGAFDPVAGRGDGLFAPSPAIDGVRPGVPMLWAVIATVGAVGLIVQRGTVWATAQYQEVQLRGMVIALVAIIAGALAIPLFRLFRAATRIAAEATAPLLGKLDPLARWRPAGVACAVLVAAALTTLWFALPQSRSVMPTRLVISAITIGLGMGIGALVRLPRIRRGMALAIAGGVLVLNVATLWKLGADIETKYVAITGSPALDRLIRFVRTANDLDRDGFGSLLGENDCSPFDQRIHPGAPDLPDDGIDQNCDGRDFTLRTTNAGNGPAMPIPVQFKRSDWNILFITVDTVRYDHTTFGGYKTSPKARDTTPRLAELVKRSTSFTDTIAPSAGTMASIPAILTSKFFHSGIALDENKPAGTPPGIKPENTTLPEIMKRAGYHTGVIASHHWWNDWGLDQGVDEYDNSIGKNNDPFIVAADRVTDHILAWVTRQQGHKWFLWAHYIDPHGRYVAHPDVVDYGSSEPDLYDAELKWTDQQIGRLLDELRRLPSDDRTIIIITSDHGESMGEHNVPTGTHGTALYTELLHVPMIFYVPNLPPKQIGGAVTNLDIVPTLAEITGADVHDLAFEGKSLVPQIFYGKEDRDRIVFSETNAPSPERAAISESWKLIFYLQANIYELYDLKADPAEKTNLAHKNPPAMGLMKSALDAWLERVVYARDQLFNQAASKNLKDLVLTAPPSPAVPTTGQTLDDGKITILGITTTPKPTPGAQVNVEVFFKVNERTPLAYKFLLAAWPVDTATWKPTDDATNLTKSSMRLTGEGFFGTERWRKGEYVRDKFTLTIPPDWIGNAVAFGLVAMDEANVKAPATGAAPANDPNLLVLGVVPR
jgi:arylsulfatase A-like enzyme